MPSARLGCCKRVQSHMRELWRLLSPCRDACTQNLGLFGKKYIPGSQRAGWDGTGVECPAGTVAARTRTAQETSCARGQSSPALLCSQRAGEALDPCTKGEKNLQRPTRDKRECQQPHLRCSWLGVQGAGTREVTTATLLPAIPNAAFPLVGVLVSPELF